MRIIAGTARSLPLKTIEGPDTRPTTDRIKETLFNILQNDIPNAYFLDLFAGSGQIGLEALSRGALYAVFVDNGRKPVKCIEDNIKNTHFEELSTVYPMDVFSALNQLELKTVFDVVFMDPPYNKELEKQVLLRLSSSSLINEDSIIVFEANKDTDISYIDSYGFEIFKIKEYKNNMHVFLRRK